MAEHKAYLGDLIGGSLMIRESQIIAKLLLKNVSQDEWKQAIEIDNVLQKPSAASAKRNATTIKKRLDGLSAEFLEALVNASFSDATQFMFAATLINSTLLADFMRSVFTDAKRMYRDSLCVDDWQHFWEGRTRMLPALADMSDASVYKISQVAFKTMTDAGYLDSTKKKHILNVFVSSDVKQLLLDMQREDIVRAMEP